MARWQTVAKLVCAPKTLATVNAGAYSIWDLRWGKKITIDSVTCQIISIKRSVMNNETTIRAIEVL